MLTNVTQADWNESAYKTATENEPEADGAIKYRAGKVISERLALDYPKHHPGLSWYIVSLCPNYVSHRFISVAEAPANIS